jgi:FkbM family methyltransferase
MKTPLSIESLILAYVRWCPFDRGKYRLVEKFGRTLTENGQVLRKATLRYGGYSMDCDLRKMLQRQFYFFGTYPLEERTLATWTEEAAKASVIFDIGANAGIYSLAAAASNPEVVVHAFEPSPDIAAHFRHTVAQNYLQNRIHVHQCAVTREGGTVQLNFFSGEHRDNEGMNYITTERRSAESIEVDSVSVDDFCHQHGIDRIDLMKIDVQGGEPAVLAGAREMINRKAIRSIYFELNWNHDDPSVCSAAKSLQLLESAGYRFAGPDAKSRFQCAGNWLKNLTDVIATSELSPVFDSKTT